MSPVCNKRDLSLDMMVLLRKSVWVRPDKFSPERTPIEGLWSNIAEFLGLTASRPTETVKDALERRCGQCIRETSWAGSIALRVTSPACDIARGPGTGAGGRRAPADDGDGAGGPSARGWDRPDARAGGQRADGP